MRRIQRKYSMAPTIYSVIIILFFLSDDIFIIKNMDLLYSNYHIIESMYLNT